MQEAEASQQPATSALNRAIRRTARYLAGNARLIMRPDGAADCMIQLGPGTTTMCNILHDIATGGRSAAAATILGHFYRIFAVVPLSLPLLRLLNVPAYGGEKAPWTASSVQERAALLLRAWVAHGAAALEDVRLKQRAWYNIIHE